MSAEIIYDCPHGMGKASSCIECMEEGPVVKPGKRPKFEAEFGMVAKFDSKCPGCGGDIQEGTRIGKTHVGWCCYGCLKNHA